MYPMCHILGSLVDSSAYETGFEDVSVDMPVQMPWTTDQSYQADVSMLCWLIFNITNELKNNFSHHYGQRSKIIIYYLTGFLLVKSNLL